MVLAGGPFHARELFQQHPRVLGGLNRCINSGLALVGEAFDMKGAVDQGEDQGQGNEAEANENKREE